MEFSEGQVDALGEFVTHRSTNFIIALALMTIGGSEALNVGDRSISQTMTLFMISTGQCCRIRLSFGGQDRLRRLPSAG